MTGPSLTLLEDEVVRLAGKYRSEGYDVVMAPRPEDLPFDLGNYRVDLVAKKNNQGVLVQVKSRADRLSFEALQPAVAEVRRHLGWRFVLVTAQDLPDIGVPDVIDEENSWEEIGSRAARARRLFDSGESEAAFIGAWIAFERILRLQAQRVALPVDRLAPAFAIRQLYSLGELSAEQYDLALQCQKVRNRVVHGLPSPELNTATENLLALVGELLATWTATAEVI